jgi:F-type H+-transporting ATPase subunit delta
VWKDAPELVRRLFGLLVDRERMGLLGAITRAYAEAWNASRGVVAAQAVSAVALDAGQHGELRAALEKATGRGVELQASVDPGVLGGLKVTLAGRTIDGTVRARLLALKRSLRGAA